MVQPVNDDDEGNLLEDMLFTTRDGNEESQLLLGPSSSAAIPQRQQERSAFDVPDVDVTPKSTTSHAAGISAQNRAREAEARRVEKALQPHNHRLDLEDDGYSSESEGECDPDGSVAICDACNKVLPLSKYDQHVSYYCKKQVAECPFCQLKFPMGMVEQHITVCERDRDPNIVTCKYCGAKMQKDELKDHAIAHLIHQQTVERQIVQRVADVEDFFEEEKLETVDKGIEPVLTKKDLEDLPVSKFQVTENQDQKDVSIKCTICQMNLESGEKVRTLRCLHLFHKGCIDKWLTTINGSCVMCKVKQKLPEQPVSPTTAALIKANALFKAERNRTSTHSTSAASGSSSMSAANSGSNDSRGAAAATSKTNTH